MFQSLSRDSGRLNSIETGPSFSIEGWFQSLSRDSGRLNLRTLVVSNVAVNVSIPQSGFGAFERYGPARVFLPSLGGFNPSVGIRGV